MSDSAKTVDSNFEFWKKSESWLSATFLVTLAVLVIPLPTVLLDMFLACNISAAIILLLVTLGAKSPLDISVFPSLLLLLTLFRLSLNVATTRLILLDGNAGKIVLTFGDFVVGGNLVVGIVIFLILITIQFIVITKGATRISEVNARFTLDALPGKQMAIDAELNAGAIDDVTAKEKRANLTREAEFYGAMDGASKYVRGDAIAGLVIMVVNVFGGVVLGLLDGQSLFEAVQVYSILTIGDGLVSQVPALLIATSSGILVTKSASDSSLGDEIRDQVSSGFKSLYVAPIILAALALTPGFPKLPFFLIAGAVMFFVWRRNDAEEEATQDQTPQENPQPASEESLEEKSLETFLQSDRVVIEVGAGLVSLVSAVNGNGIAERVSKLREDLAREHGLWVPKARLRDNLGLPVEQYRLIIGGREVATGNIKPNFFLAINPGSSLAPLSGEKTTDPAFNLEATWIEETERRRAELKGYTVVDAATVVITHLGEVLKTHAHELLSRQDLQKMLDKLKEVAPSTVEDVRSDVLRPSTLHQVLVNLLREGVPITGLESIVEAAVEYGPGIKDPIALTEKVRGKIGHHICERFRFDNNKVRVIIIEPSLEHRLRQSATENSIAIRPDELERLISQLLAKWETARIKNEPAAVLVDSSIRLHLYRTVSRSLPNMAIIAYNEIPNGLLIESSGIVTHEDVFGSAGVDMGVDLSMMQESANSAMPPSNSNSAQG